MIIDWIRSIRLSELFKELDEANIINGKSYGNAMGFAEMLFEDYRRFQVFDLDTANHHDEMAADIAKFIAKRIGATDYVLIDCGR